ncbi:hypothetical protein PSEWESI4_01989 [Pseudomonas carbonaria]|uniref:Uncharacterized protein n=1 Tax=Zestomonas carbonaria TaxID=2762745 RepID=A0A7U7EMF7_9GAMM|nr:hypothetical protein PSEWESI4_01989 [Pseudomonas carbonaria]
MTLRYAGWLVPVFGAILLALGWWGWQRGGLALLQLGLGC